MDDLTLDLRGLEKRFNGVRALDGLSLAVAPGEVYGLLGPNGAGKTTLLRIVCGVLAADGGTGWCLGSPLGGPAPANLGYVPQRGGLYDDLTVLENLDFYARAYGSSNPRPTVARTVEAHGLASIAKMRVGALSGGWRQRTALAAVLLHEPELVLLDEPTAGLDPEAREELWSRIRRLATEGVALLITTHHADEAERCDRIGYLTAGRMRAEGAPHRLAAELGLAVWRLPRGAALMTASLPALKGIRYSQDSDGWCAVGVAGSVAFSALDAWCMDVNQSHDVIAPRLADALRWLSKSSEDMP